MKKILYLFAILAAAFSVSSCTNEVEDIFGETAAERAAKGVENVQKILEEAPNGWRMEYYGAKSFGGYNVLCKFNNEKVTFASEKLGKNHPAGFGEDGKVLTSESHYRLGQSQGVLLSFDENSNIFHYFSTPKNPDGYGTDDHGFEGDFEFSVVSATPEKIVLLGKKHQARIDMYPISADQTWESYLKSVEETEAYMGSRSYTLKGEGVEKEIKVVQNYRSMIFSYEEDSVTKDTKNVSAPYIVTPEGYVLYEPVEVDGIKISTILKGDKDGFYYLSDNNKIWLESEIPPLWETLKEGQWFVAYSEVGEFARPAWDAFHDKLLTGGKNGAEMTLYWAFIGTYQKHEAFHFQADNDYGYIPFTFESGSEDGSVVKINYNTGSANKAGRTYVTDFALEGVLKSFAGLGTRVRTFKIETDNPRLPTYLKLVDQKEPTNIITLYAREINLPFKN